MCEDIDKELQKLAAEYGFIRPDRGNLDDPSIQWREGKPDFRKADLSFFKGRTTNHQAGSLPMIVENLVKQWEMEMTHKTNSKDWKTVETSEYCVHVNGGEAITGEEAAKVGTYNWLMGNVPKNLYDAEATSFEDSHKLFRGAFPDGFPWEVLEVFSGPPRVAFSWHHWGIFNGEYNGRKGQGETVELYGFTIASLTAELKITKLEVYAKFDGFLQALQGILPLENELKSSFCAGCPIYKEKAS